jgi:hypothetical protein
MKYETFDLLRIRNVTAMIRPYGAIAIGSNQPLTDKETDNNNRRFAPTDDHHRSNE